MSLDLQNSYQQAQDKLKAFKTFTEVKSAIKDAQKKTENQLQPNFNLSRFQLDQSAIEQKIKVQVQNQFDQLIGLILANKGAGGSTFQFIIRKLIRTVKIIKSKILEIIIEEFVRALGCDIEQTYTAGQFYIKISSIL
jgi:formate-dependent nitrite reductase cytochrome c552 subunit